MFKSIKANANMNSLLGSCTPDNVDEEYKQYRKAWIENPEKFIVRNFPLHIDIEATNRCNLRCTFCDKLPYWTKEQIGDIDFNLYKKIIDEGSEYNLWGVKLSYRGEPLLHKHIVEMVYYAKRKGIIDIYFNTNAMLLNENKSRGFIDSGLDRISISIEGTDSEKFSQMRVGADFDVIKKNIHGLMDLREQQNVSYPKIRIQTVDLEEIDINEYKEYWSDFADEVAVIDYKDSENRITGIISPYACPQPWQRMTIEWDGSIFPCNNDDLRVLKLGNVKTDSIFSLWNSDQINQLRKNHMDGNAHTAHGCDGCPWRTTQIEKR